MKLLVYFIIGIFTVPVFGQKVHVDRPARFITEFNFRQLNGGVMLLTAKFNNMPDSFNFILDTGSGSISLDSTTVEKYAIPHEPSGRYMYGIAGVRKVDYSKNNSLTFPGLKVDSLDFYINDYEILTNVYGIKVDGIIGYSFLSRYIVKVDFDSLKIRVYDTGTIKYPRYGLLLHPTLRGLPIVPLVIKDARTVAANYYFDTGAGLCFLISSQFKKDSAILLKRRKPVTTLVQGLGGKSQMHLTIIQKVQIGNYKFRRVPTYILDDEFKLFSRPSLGGLIGNDILRRFNLIINYPHEEIHLLPNNHFHDHFDYSYTGMSLYNFNGIIQADDIVDGSPADKAGIKNGDVIIGIDNDFSNDIEKYKNQLQKAGERVALLIRRENIPIIITMRVSRIR
jgi:hypothetical protein